MGLPAQTVISQRLRYLLDNQTMGLPAGARPLKRTWVQRGRLPRIPVTVDGTHPVQHYCPSLSQTESSRPGRISGQSQGTQQFSLTQGRAFPDYRGVYPENHPAWFTYSSGTSHPRGALQRSCFFPFRGLRVGCRKETHLEQYLPQSIQRLRRFALARQRRPGRSTLPKPRPERPSLSNQTPTSVFINGPGACAHGARRRPRGSSTSSFNSPSYSERGIARPMPHDSYLSLFFQLTVKDDFPPGGRVAP